MNGWLALGIVATIYLAITIAFLYIGAAIANQRGRE
jgi:hypothetical protein